MHFYAETTNFALRQKNEPNYVLHFTLQTSMFCIFKLR